jgi:hypothetical protein
VTISADTFKIPPELGTQSTRNSVGSNVRTLMMSDLEISPDASANRTVIVLDGMSVRVARPSRILARLRSDHPFASIRWRVTGSPLGAGLQVPSEYNSSTLTDNRTEAPGDTVVADTDGSAKRNSP